MKHDGSLLVIMMTCISLISPGWAISCYQCNSRVQHGCDLSDRINHYYSDCNTLQDRCLKVAGPKDLVVRSCAVSSAPLTTEGCVTNGDIRTCVCFTNYCNTASSLKSFTVLMLIVPALPLVFR